MDRPRVSGGADPGGGVTRPDPAEYAWWLSSRAAGVVAFLLLALSVLLGLAMANRLVSGRGAIKLHEHLALAGLVAIAVHGITLLGDAWLNPGIKGLLVPFAIDFKPAYVACGIVAGYLAAMLGLSYYARRWVGAARWRKLHRYTLLSYVLGVVHTLGAGTDASAPWMRAILLVTGAPILFLFVLRMLPEKPRAAVSTSAAPGGTPPAEAALARGVATARGFARYRVTEVTPESSDVTSFALEPEDGSRIEPFPPGRFLTVRVDVPGAGEQLRSYSLSAAWHPRRHRISIKREGLVSAHLHRALEVGDVLEAAGPAGPFVLDTESVRPVVLVSAGVGATPVLAMLHTLAKSRSRRDVLWVHGARCGAQHPFREEVREHVARLERGRIHVRYSQPDLRDVPGHDFHATGRLTASAVLDLGVGDGAEFYLCGPAAFTDDLIAGLRAAGIPTADIRFERFGPGAPAAAVPAAPPPAVSTGAGTAVTFSRSGVAATWAPGSTSLLDLAEAHAVPAVSGCRVGACHGCAVGIREGAVRHDPEPLSPAPTGTALLCCAKPEGDVVLDV
jgi:ferredoxin-NADP reductase/DMSO/TMAO reductase YedYZ heme-binding membrane subunit